MPQAISPNFCAKEINLGSYGENLSEQFAQTMIARIRTFRTTLEDVTLVFLFLRKSRARPQPVCISLYLALGTSKQVERWLVGGVAIAEDVVALRQADEPDNRHCKSTQYSFAS